LRRLEGALGRGLSRSAGTLSLVLLAALTPASVLAKRATPKPVQPLVRGGVSYRAGHLKDATGNSGTVEAVEVASGRQLWSVTVYQIPLRPGLETDVQDVFITRLELDGSCLRVTDERQVQYCIDLLTQRVQVLSTAGGRSGKVDMRRFDEVRAAVQAAAEPLWRKLRPEEAPEGGPPPRGEPGPPRFPKEAWFARASPLPLPHAWPPDGDAQLEVVVFAYCLSGHIADGERQSAPFARAVVDAGTGDVLRVEQLGSGFRELGVQGVRPVSPSVWASIDVAIARLREVVASGKTPDAVAAVEIRKGYCAFLNLNGLLAKELQPLRPAFFGWLGCSEKAQ
jgi:hypothetical protein